MREPKLNNQSRAITTLTSKLAGASFQLLAHVDYSTSGQTVDSERHGLFHTVMQRLNELMRCLVIINTSFNVRSEPKAYTPQDLIPIAIVIVLTCLFIFLVGTSAAPFIDTVF